jgi:Fe-S-cluster containining protein
MKTIKLEDISNVPGKQLDRSDIFSFRCRPELACYNQCCRNLNLFLYPYDIIRLKQILGISSETFLDQYVDIVMREGNYFPDVLLKMSENSDHSCIFCEAEGCRVYAERPYTCRTFPMEYGLQYAADGHNPELIGFLRPPDFCLGSQADDQWTLQSWVHDQGADQHQKMAKQWSEVKRLFQKDPWGDEGPQGKRAKMAFMASYNMDAFRAFVYGSSLLKRFKVKTELLKKMRTDDVALVRFGFDWIRLSVWGVSTKQIRRR